jgi:hypothetical protein
MRGKTSHLAENLKTKPRRVALRRGIIKRRDAETRRKATTAGTDISRWLKNRAKHIWFEGSFQGSVS